MAKAGWSVQVVEKHEMPGGRARKLVVNGFTFDMGPSWYWMPDVFERFFNQFNKKVSDYYTLVRLDPSYKVYWPDGENEIPADYQQLKNLFEKYEPGSGEQLDAFLKEARFKYNVGINKLVHKPGQSWLEFLDADLVKGFLKLDVFTSVKKHVAKHFAHPKLRELLEFPVLFLGALPRDTPALYTLMNYADIIGGTWYPDGGMFCIVDGMFKLAKELGVKFHFEEEVNKLEIENGRVKKVITTQKQFEADVVIAGADYHHVETKLLRKEYRSYSESYWNSRVMAPGCLLYYIGLNKKLKNIQHHSLFFDVPFDAHGKEIYKTKEWPKAPLFYVSATSVTDKNTAPEGCENLFFLIPVAAGLNGDNTALREKYFNLIVDRFEKRIGETIKDSVIYKKTFAHSDFVHEYSAFKGNAYGLANTLMQTAILKPDIRSKKVKNLFYTGQLTVPGPGVPPSLISGEVVAKEVTKVF